MTSHSYLVSCECGRELAVEAGQAGAVVTCHGCHKSVEVPRLTRLRELPLVAGLAEERHPLQFRLTHLFGLVTYIALALTCGKYVGFLETVGICLFAVFWGLAYAIQPLPVVYATVLGTLLLTTWNLLICSVQQSRESARRNWTTNNLKTLGIEYQNRTSFWPEPTSPGAAGERAKLESFIRSRTQSRSAAQ